MVVRAACVTLSDPSGYASVENVAQVVENGLSRDRETPEKRDTMSNNEAQNVTTDITMPGEGVMVESVTGTIVAVHNWTSVESLDALSEEAYEFLVKAADTSQVTIARVCYLVQAKASGNVTLTRLAQDIDLTHGRASQLATTYGILVRLNLAKNAENWRLVSRFMREVKADTRESVVATLQAESGLKPLERMARIAEVTRTASDAKKNAAAARAGVQVPAIGAGDPDNGDVKVPAVSDVVNDVDTVEADVPGAEDAPADGQADKSEKREAQPDVREIATDNVSSWSKAEFLAALTRMAEFVESDNRQWALKSDGENIRATDALARIEAAILPLSVAV